MELHDHPAVFCSGASVFSAMAALLLAVDLLSAIACRILVGHRKSLAYQFAWPLPNGKTSNPHSMLPHGHPQRLRS
jgi:hypothetical protein